MFLTPFEPRDIINISPISLSRSTQYVTEPRFFREYLLPAFKKEKSVRNLQYGPQARLIRDTKAF